MKQFSDWFAELTSDERWHEQAAMNHRPETFREVANKVYVNGLADADAFFITPMREHRQHVFNKVSKLPHDKVKKKWFDVEEKKTEPEWQPVTWTERAKRLEEFQRMVDNSPIMQPQAPLTAREKMNQDFRPLPPDVKEPTEVQKRAAYLKHLILICDSRRATFLEAYPDATTEEIDAYLDKFKEVDNPLGI